MFDASAYAGQLTALLPQGRAWPADSDSNLGRLMDGIAQELARVDGRADSLADEADPRSTLELLADWERVAGLPDACFGQPDTVQERQVAVVSRITSVGGQSAAYFIGLAASLGYVVTIDEFRPATCIDPVGLPCFDSDWAHAWRMNILPLDEDLPADQFYIAWSSCVDPCDIPLRGWGAIDLECLIRRHRPAHSIVLFSYQVEPETLFWFDFTF